MLKAYKYRLLPTEEQKHHFNGLFGACRFIYNLALETKIAAWKSAQKNITAYDLMKQMTELRATECRWLKEYPYQCLESAISHLDSAYSMLFRGGGFPNFKNKNGRQSVTFRQNSRIEGAKIKLSKIGFVGFIKHRNIPEGKIRSVVISRESSGNYFVSILVKDGMAIPNKLPALEETAIGIDLGLKEFAILSNGQTFQNPKYLASCLKRLRIEQRKLSRRHKRGAKTQSKRYNKQKLTLAKLHDKIANKRKDFLHKTSTAIIKQFDTVCLEDLNIKGMLQNAKLSKAISDVGWSYFNRMLTYKAEWYGKNIIRIGRFEPTSKTCSDCGHIFKEILLSDREWTCINCESTHDRDLNAAINIKNIGLQAKPSTAKVSQKTVLIG